MALGIGSSLALVLRAPGGCWRFRRSMPLTRWETVSNSRASWPRCPPKASTCNCAVEISACRRWASRSSAGKALFGLRRVDCAGARPRRPLHNGDARLFLLTLEFGQAVAAAEASCWLGKSCCAAATSAAADSSICAIGFALGFEGGQACCACASSAWTTAERDQQFGATLFVVCDGARGAIDFERDLIQALAVLADLASRCA